MQKIGRSSGQVPSSSEILPPHGARTHEFTEVFAPMGNAVEDFCNGPIPGACSQQGRNKVEQGRGHALNIKFTSLSLRPADHCLLIRGGRDMPAFYPNHRRL